MEQEKGITFLQVRFLDGFVKNFSDKDAQAAYAALSDADRHDEQFTCEIYNEVDDLYLTINMNTVVMYGKR